MQRLLIPTGYMGSGSSAITDILGEFEGIDASHKDFEFVFLHCPNGLFDLEDKLLVGNNAIRSDEALRSFRAAMKELYDKPFWWPGNYKKNVTPEFMNLTDEFIKEITQFKSNTFWYYQERRGISAFPKLATNKALRALTRGTINPLKPLKYKDMKISLTTPEEFYTAAQTYLKKLFSVFSDSANIVVDQLLLPPNLWRMKNYLPDNAECFVVERDPRDMFFINKYIWVAKNFSQVPYPTDVKEFCGYYKKLRQIEHLSTPPMCTVSILKI